MKYKCEKFKNTPIDEKETMIHIINKERNIHLWTHDVKIYKRFSKVFGQPSERLYEEVGSERVLSLVGWSFDYMTNREMAKKIISITNLLPRAKMQVE